MNLSENELESVLRRAPTPVPPPSLEAELVRGISAARAADPRDGRAYPTPRGLGRSGFRKWWPVLLPGFAAAALAAGWVVQQSELDQLRTEVRSLRLQAETPAGEDSRLAESGSAPGSAVQPDAGARADLERLRAAVEALAAEVGVLEEGSAANDRLRAAIKALEARMPKELQASLVMADRAQSIRCVNNLKQLGLSVRVWASDNEDEFPPDILSMTNEMATPKILVCPADEGRQEAADWASYTAANCSYEFLSPGPGKFETEPNRLLWRCPIHGNVGLCDGSVQMGLAKDHPERLELVNGAWYVRRDDPGTFVVTGATGAGVGAGAATASAVPAGAGGSVPPAVLQSIRQGAPVVMDPVLARRYGLMVPTETNGANANANAETETEVEVEVEGFDEPTETAPSPR
jgi:hypothetical protein